MEYKSVVFDMDGVILNFEGDGFQWKYEAVREALEEKKVSPESFSRTELDAFIGDKGVEECVKACNSCGVDAEEIWNLIAVKTTKARVEMIENGKFSLYPDAREVLDGLKDSEIRLGIISNAPEMAVEATVNYYNLRDHFKFFRGVTDFKDLSDRKPHPDHLEYARAELKREPFLYVGDAESDIIAAREADMESVWVNRNDGSVDVRPDHEIEDLRKLMNIVREEEKVSTN